MIETNERQIQVGDGATLLYPSDRYPYTVLRVVSQTRIFVQEDNEHIVGGKWPDFTYNYSRNLHGRVYELKYSEKHGWYPMSVFSRCSRWEEGRGFYYGARWEKLTDSIRERSRFAVGYRRYYRSPEV